MLESTIARPVAEGLLAGTDGEPRLLGSRCRGCATVTFPVSRSCPRCTSQDVDTMTLASQGTLWTWTIQGYPPKPPYAGAPEDFVPYGVGYVELPGQVRVEAILTESDPDRLRIGMPMRLVLIAAPGDAGTVTYAFAPIAEEAP